MKGCPRTYSSGLGLRTTARYSALGALKAMTDPESNTTTYHVDGLNRVTGVDHPESFSEAFEYDGEGLVTRHVDRRGVTSRMSYDNLGRPLNTEVQGFGQTIDVSSITYDDVARTEVITDANGNPTVRGYDGLHRVASIRNAKGDTRSFIYDGVNLRRETDFYGRETKTDYDELDRPILVTDRLNHVTTIAHQDAGGHTMTVTDRNGHESVQVSDPLGRLVSLAKGGLPLAAYEYDGNGNRTAQTDGLGNRTEFDYDGANRLATITHPGGLQTETFGYDANGNKISHNDGFGANREMTWDGLDRMRTSRINSGSGLLETVLNYDGEGNVLTRRDPKGTAFTTTFGYNALGSLVSVTDADSKTWTYGRDDNQNLVSVTDPLGRQTTYLPDELNRVTEIHQPMGLITRMTYTKNSLVETRTDPKGQIERTVYDDEDRAISTTYENVAAGTIGITGYTWVPDAEGNVRQVVERPSGPGSDRTYQVDYDARDRVTETTDCFGRSVAFTYDAANNVRTVTGATNETTTLGYDPKNRLQSVSMTGGTATYEYEANDLVRAVRFGNGMERLTGYDAADRLTSVENRTGSTTERFTYGLDLNSNRESEVRSLDGVVRRSVQYGYDLVDRLTSAAYTTPAVGETPASTRTVTYGYDAVGNRLTEAGQDPVTGAAISRTYTVDSLDRLLSITGDAAGAATFAYDANGNATTETRGGETTTYTVDVRDQVRRIERGGVEVGAYDYDYARRRISKTAAMVRTDFVYDGSDVLEEFGASSQRTGRYEYGLDLLRSTVGGDTTWSFADGQGSVTMLARAGGVVAERREYEAFGQVMERTGASLVDVGYTGQRLDGESGLMPLGSGERYYAPGMGRFVQQDRVAGDPSMPQSLNRFGYVKGNPLKYTDPTGNEGVGDYLVSSRGTRLPTRSFEPAETGKSSGGYVSCTAGRRIDSPVARQSTSPSGERVSRAIADAWEKAVEQAKFGAGVVWYIEVEGGYDLVKGIVWDTPRLLEKFRNFGAVVQPGMYGPVAPGYGIDDATEVAQMLYGLGLLANQVLNQPKEFTAAQLWIGAVQYGRTLAAQSSFDQGRTVGRLFVDVVLLFVPGLGEVRAASKVARAGEGVTAASRFFTGASKARACPRGATGLVGAGRQAGDAVTAFGRGFRSGWTQSVREALTSTFGGTPLDALVKGVQEGVRDSRRVLRPVGRNTTRMGVKRNNPASMRQLMDTWDKTAVDAFSHTNREAIEAGLNPHVDEQWIKHFPGDADLFGEPIRIHHIQGSPIFVALPKSRHMDAQMPGGFRYNPGGPGRSG